LATVRSRVPALSLTRSIRVVPAVDGPSALVTPAVPSLAMISLTNRIVLDDVPIATICAPRSMPAASAGAPSNDSLMVAVRATASVTTRKPKPALAPEL
jgi:hypothetical protein